MTVPGKSAAFPEKKSRPQVSLALSAVNAEVREHLREWRRITAKEQGVPAYIVLHDATLDEICRVRPASITDLLSVSGIGERKADTYGHGILGVLRRYRDNGVARV